MDITEGLTRRRASDLCEFIGAGRDSALLLKRLENAELLVNEAERATVLRIIDEAFAKEKQILADRAAFEKDREERVQTFHKESEAALAKATTDADRKQLKATFRRLPLEDMRYIRDTERALSGEERAHKHLDLALAPFLSAKGRRLLSCRWGEELERPPFPGALTLEDLHSSPRRETLDLDRYHSIVRQSVPNRSCGFYRSFSYKERGRVSIKLQFGFLDGKRIYKTEVSTVMECFRCLDEKYAGDDAEPIPVREDDGYGYHANVVLESTINALQRDGYAAYFRAVARYDDRNRDSTISATQADIDEMLAVEESIDLGRAVYDDLSKMWPGQERKTAAMEFLTEWHQGRYKYFHRMEG